MLLAVKYSIIGMTFRLSSMPHPDSGRTVLAAQFVGTGSNAGYYYCSLVCDSLRFSCSRFKSDGERIIRVTREMFLK